MKKDLKQNESEYYERLRGQVQLRRNFFYANRKFIVNALIFGVIFVLLAMNLIAFFIRPKTAEKPMIAIFGASREAAAAAIETYGGSVQITHYFLEAEQRDAQEIIADEYQVYLFEMPLSASESVESGLLKYKSMAVNAVVFLTPSGDVLGVRQLKPPDALFVVGAGTSTATALMQYAVQSRQWTVAYLSGETFESDLRSFGWI